MTHRDGRHSPVNRLVTRLPLTVGVAFALLVVGCNQATPTPRTGITSSPAGPTASVEPSAPSSDAASSSSTRPVGQTETDWGPIWDSLPTAFPVYPGVTPAEETETGPASAAFALEGVDARTVASWMEAELERAGYRTESLNGPFEDGSFVLESTSLADCRIEVVTAPLGSLTTVTIRYGAACPGPQP